MERAKKPKATVSRIRSSIGRSLRAWPGGYDPPPDRIGRGSNAGDHASDSWPGAHIKARGLGKASYKDGIYGSEDAWFSGPIFPARIPRRLAILKPPGERRRRAHRHAKSRRWPGPRSASPHPGEPEPIARSGSRRSTGSRPIPPRSCTGVAPLFAIDRRGRRTQRPSSSSDLHPCTGLSAAPENATAFARSV